jgi:hypothetical protein
VWSVPGVEQEACGHGQRGCEGGQEVRVQRGEDHPSSQVHGEPGQTLPENVDNQKKVDSEMTDNIKWTVTRD